MITQPSSRLSSAVDASIAISAPLEAPTTVMFAGGRRRRAAAATAATTCAAAALGSVPLARTSPIDRDAGTSQRGEDVVELVRAEVRAYGLPPLLLDDAAVEVDDVVELRVRRLGERREHLSCLRGAGRGRERGARDQREREG